MKIEMSDDNGIVKSAKIFGSALCVNLFIEDGGAVICKNPVIKKDSITWLYYTEDDKYDSVTLIPESASESIFIRRTPFYSTKSGMHTHLTMLDERLTGG